MAKLKVLRNGSVRSTANGATFRRMTGIAARLRKGYTVEIAPYPSANGKWLVRVVAPTRGSNQTMTTVDSYYQVVARNQAEAERFIKTDGLWGGALAERISKTIGDLGEAHFVSRLRGAGIFDSIWGKQVRFTDIHQFQNASGHGVDAIARIAHAAPPPPPNVGDFVAFEVKSTLGVTGRPPSIGARQKTPSPLAYVRDRLQRARNAPNYPNLSAADRNFLNAALAAAGPRGTGIHLRKGEVVMDHAGNLSSAGGRPAIATRTW
ncbi:hypothetical protein [Tritonibacter mobilis]|uniref:hypothetical protein n=2 Tax=Tritonibacter mobilis TaxID=379347 RepID=UPI0001B8A3C0|nr:hypothetical protein [Tritonibacter mobilis]EEW61166.1 hypothetical protein SCH4B_0133 [Ruegeria sp. TrichCH4B]